MFFFIIIIFPFFICLFVYLFVGLEPGLPPKVGRLEDGRRASDEGGKRKLTGCR